MKIGYFLSETITNLRRNLLMTVAAISTVAISLLLLGGVQILGMVVNNVTLSWEAKVEVSAYFRDDAQPERDREHYARRASYARGRRGVLRFEGGSLRGVQEDLRGSTASSTRTCPRTHFRPRFASSSRTPTYADQVRRAIDGAPGVDDVRYGGDSC